MTSIQHSLSTLSSPGSSDSARKMALDDLRRYYSANKEAHREYLQKGIYEKLPELAEFKTVMEQIETALSEEMQLKMF